MNEAFGIVLLVLGVGLGLLWFSARSAITILLARVDRGKLSVESGGIAPRILSDLSDVVRRPKIKHAVIRIVRDRGRARVQVKGRVSASQLQRIRNVVGSVPLAALVNTPRKS